MRRKILDQQGINYLTITVIDLTGIFTRKECKDIIIESLRHGIEEKEQAKLTGYLLQTPSVAQASKEGTTLSDIQRYLKKYTARKIVDWIKTAYSSFKKLSN